jgi:DNA-binding GntR family transcriptional regulator
MGKSASADVADVLRQRVLAGFYSEEQFIRQESVAQELGVSRIPVREALAQLEQEGLVQRVKFRGALVPKRSTAEIVEIYELRLLIEPFLLRMAVAKITSQQLRDLRDILQRSRETDIVAEWTALNVAFHRRLFAAADRPLTLQTLDNLLTRADRYLKMQNFLSASTKAESDAEHARLLDLVAAGDAYGAVQVLTDHISWNQQDVIASAERSVMPMSGGR